jgi:hypothetical protein
MRKIKFRAWDSIIKKMIYDANSDIKIYLNGSISQHGSWVDPEVVVLQWTGLKDKKGKEIYEGDIILNEYGHKCEIVWQVHGFYYTRKRWRLGWNKRFAHLSEDKFEVIGNIYENPELLQGGGK